MAQKESNTAAVRKGNSDKKRKANHDNHASPRSSSSKKQATGTTSNSSSAVNTNKGEGSAKSQKRALKHERQSHRKHADAVSEAKKIWNQLRLKSNTKEEIQAMTAQLLTLLRGKVPQVALQHDASRVVQAALQFGTNEERTEILQELCANNNLLLELTKNQYAHFVVLKAIKYGVHSPDCIKLIVKAVKGHIPKLAVHATGCKIVEALFQTFPNQQTAVLKQEFYGPHVSLFAADTSTTKGATTIDLATVPAKTQQAALTFLRTNILDKGMQKSLFGYQYFQNVFCDYVSHATPNDIRDMAPSVVDHAIHLLSSKAGTRVVAACASYGTAKERRKLSKSLKGFSRSALLHADAYLAILRIVQVTDDTVSIHKNILQELLTLPTKEDNHSKPQQEKKEGQDHDDDDDDTVSPLLELALNDRACKLFLMLLVSSDDDLKKIFDPYELAILETNPMVQEGGQAVPTSKKDPDTRRDELLQYLQKPLISLCQHHAKELIMSVSGSALIRTIYDKFHPPAVVDAIVQVCQANVDAASSGNDDEHGKEQHDDNLFEDRVGHLAIKNLILADVENDSGTLLSKAFFNKFQGRLVDVAKSNRGAFVVAALCKVPGVRDDAIKILRKKRSVIQERAGGSKASAGYQALLKEIDGSK